MIHLSEFLRLFAVVSQPFKNVPGLFFSFFFPKLDISSELLYYQNIVTFVGRELGEMLFLGFRR